MLVGPALILTTVVLACGLVVTVFSDLPSLRLFGWLSAFSMVAALVADLFILRPTSMFLINLAENFAAAARRQSGSIASGRRIANRAMSTGDGRLSQPFVIVMLTPRISPLESICTTACAVGAQVQLGGKAGGLDEHVDLAAAGGALQIAEDVAALLAPVAGDALALAGHVAGRSNL